MLERYFAAPKMLGHLRAGPSGQYVDGFAAALHSDGYNTATAVHYIRAAAHLGHVLQEQGGTLADIDIATFLPPFAVLSLSSFQRGRRNHHTLYGARRLRGYLVRLGVCKRSPIIAGTTAHRRRSFCRSSRASVPTVSIAVDPVL